MRSEHTLFTSIPTVAAQAMPATTSPVAIVLVWIASRTNNGAQKAYANKGMAIRRFVADSTHTVGCESARSAVNLCESTVAAALARYQPIALFVREPLRVVGTISQDQ